MSAHRKKAAVLMDIKRFDLAEAEYRAALREDPRDFEALQWRAECLRRLHRKDEAEQAAREAMAVNPSRPMSYVTLADLISLRNQWDEAFALLKQAAALDPDDSYPHQVEALLHRRRRQWAEALTAAERSLAIDAENDASIDLRGRTLTDLGRLEEAEAVLREGLRRRPESAEFHHSLAHVHLKTGRAQAAVASFQEALRLAPDWEEPWYGLLKAKRMVSCPDFDTPHVPPPPPPVTLRGVLADPELARITVLAQVVLVVLPVMIVRATLSPAAEQPWFAFGFVLCIAPLLSIVRDVRPVGSVPKNETAASRPWTASERCSAFDPWGLLVLTVVAPAAVWVKVGCLAGLDLLAPALLLVPALFTPCHPKNPPALQTTFAIGFGAAVLVVGASAVVLVGLAASACKQAFEHMQSAVGLAMPVVSFGIMMLTSLKFRSAREPTTTAKPANP